SPAGEYGPAAAGSRAPPAPGAWGGSQRGDRSRRLFDLRLRRCGRAPRSLPDQPPRVSAYGRTLRELRHSHPAATGGPAKLALLPALPETVTHRRLRAAPTGARGLPLACNPAAPSL